MGLFLAIALFAWLISKAVNDAKLDHTYARQGMVSPRLEAKYGGRDKAQARVAKYGFFDHLRDAWRDSWARRTDAMVAGRNARAANGRRLSLRERFRAARTVVDAPPAGRPLRVEPSSVPAQRQPGTPEPAVSPPAWDAGTDPEPGAEPDRASEPGPFDLTPDPVPDPGPAASTTTTPAPGGTTVTQSTGEVVNFETALADLDARIAELQKQVDLADAALADITAAEASVEALQNSYEPTAQAAATAMDSKDSLGLDGTTMTHAATAVEAMPVGAVNNLYEATEAVKQATQERRDQAAVALEAAEAEREHLIATYADAHETVASNLGGNSEFLDSSGGNAGVAVGHQDGYHPSEAVSEAEPAGAH